MIITINGKEGSGKSTIAMRLAQELGLTRYYIGGMRREAAKKRGMTLAEFNTWSETHPEGDKEFDAYLEHLGKTEDNFVIESRTAFHFIPNSIKLYLDVDLDVAAKRIFTDEKLKTRNERKDIGSIDEIKAGLIERMQSDNARYRKYYNIDIHDLSKYDFVLDTSTIPATIVYDHIIDFLKKSGSLTRD